MTAVFVGALTPLATLAEALPHPHALTVIALAVVGSRLRPGAIEAPQAAVLACVGGAMAGPAATAAWLAPQVADAKTAARLIALACATAALSPLTPGPALLTQASPAYALWAAPPCIAAALVAWPWGAPRPRVPMWSAGVGVAVLFAWATHPLIGLAVAGVAAARTLRAPVHSKTDSTATAARWGAAVAVLVAVAQLAGVTWFLGRGVMFLDRDVFGGAALVGAGALLASLLDPLLVTAAVARGAEQTVGFPATATWPLALGIGLGPGVALLVGAGSRGWRTLAWGAGFGVVQVGIAVAWALTVRPG